MNQKENQHMLRVNLFTNLHYWSFYDAGNTSCKKGYLSLFMRTLKAKDTIIIEYSSMQDFVSKTHRKRTRT